VVRVLSAFALAIPVLLVLWLAPPFIFLWLVVLISVLAAWEFQGLIKECGWVGVRWEGAVDVALLVLALWAGGMAPGLALTFIFLRLLVRAMNSTDHKAGLAGAGVSVLGLLWIGGACALVVKIRILPGGGKEALLFLFAIVWANDIAAYYVGRAVGFRKLAPSISPGKTIEGAFGGLAAGCVAGLALAIWLKPGGMSLGLAFAAALVLGVLAQVGDLFESFFKRAAARKDSGTAIPGHGGFLDRIDGLLLSAPPFYYFLRWIAAGPA
jgi:phosphatidate cytidylyltransferase